MYPPKFEYQRAASIEEALQMKREHEDAKFLAGGHSLIPVLKLRLAMPEMLIDIGRIGELRGITVSNGSTKIGALTTHSMVERSTALPDILPEAAGWIGDPMVRNRGTVGGNIAHADPASDLPTVFTALGGKVHMQGVDGSRAVEMGEFFTGLFETALDEDEMLTAVEIPSKKAGTGTAYAKMMNPASRYAIVGAAAVVTKGADGHCTAASTAIGGLTHRAVACTAVASALVGKPLTDENIEAAAQAISQDLADEEIMGDIHASAEYRREMAAVFMARAIRKAAERC